MSDRLISTAAEPKDDEKKMDATLIALDIKHSENDCVIAFILTSLIYFSFV